MASQLAKDDRIKMTKEELLRGRTPEEMEKLPVLTELEILVAIEKGRHDAELARRALTPGRISRRIFRAMDRLGA